MDEIVEVAPVIRTLNRYWKYVTACRGVVQSKVYHPEGDVYTHLLQTVEYAMKEGGDVHCILAALLHDIGKKENPRGHEEVAVGWLQGTVSDKTLWLINNHMRIHLYLTGELKSKKKANLLVDNPWFPDLVRLSRWDKLGRRQYYEPDKIKVIGQIVEYMVAGEYDGQF